MILEAFAAYLHNNPDQPADEALAAWLWERLKAPPVSVVDRVIHCEIAICRSYLPAVAALRLPEEAELTINRKLKAKQVGGYYFQGSSASGKRLLSSLHEYSLSYEQQKWSRFVHSLKASDFKGIK